MLIKSTVSSGCYSSFIWNTWYGIYALYTSWAIMKKQKEKLEGWYYNIRRENMPKEQTLFIQKDDSV